MLKEEPKWMAICDPPKLGSGSSKRSIPNTKEAGDEGADWNERPGGRKAAKRRVKEKANNSVIDSFITQLNELNSYNTNMNKLFKDFIVTVKEEKLRR